MINNYKKYKFMNVMVLENSIQIHLFNTNREYSCRSFTFLTQNIEMSYENNILHIKGLSHQATSHDDFLTDWKKSKEGALKDYDGFVCTEEDLSVNVTKIFSFVLRTKYRLKYGTYEYTDNYKIKKQKTFDRKYSNFAVEVIYSDV